jgi:hypothetical protein
MHAIIDNFSRRILAWCVDPKFDTNATSRLITEASKGLKEVEEKSPPQVYMESGDEWLFLNTLDTIQTGASLLRSLSSSTTRLCLIPLAADKDQTRLFLELEPMFQKS